MVINVLRKIKNNIFPSKQSRRVQPWVKDNGDKTHRLNYQISKASIVFDLGGYEGQWASDIYSMYSCKVYVFEPFKVYASKIARRFKQNDNIIVYDFGLGRGNSIEHLGISNDASSIFKSKNKAETVEIEIKDVLAFLAEENIENIDLLKVNIEGGEFDLLECLISSGKISMVKNLQVQFHDFVPDAKQRMKNIQNKLKLTHHTTYQYEFVWENWEKNS